jgi:O-antigen/teichoic acid export membrane protein
VSRNAARGALLGIVGQAWHLITAFLLYKFLANQLGLASFGQWRLVLSVLVWFEIFVNSGLVKMSTKAIAEKPGEGERLARATYLGQLVVAAGVFGLLVVLAGPIAAGLSDPRAATLLRIAALDIPLYAAFTAAGAIVLGRGHYERQAVAWIIYATAKFAFIAGLVWFGFSVPGALIGNALSSLVGFAVVFVPWRGAAVPFRDLRRLALELLVASMPFLGLALLEGLGQSVDLWTVSALGTGAVLLSWYASAAVLADMPTFLLAGVNRVLFPSVASAGADGDHRLVGHYAVQGLRVALIITVFAVAAIAATGRQALTFAYNPKYIGAYIPVTFLMVASVGRSVRSACTEVLLATNRSGLAVGILVGSVVLEVVLLVALTPRFGVNGAAAGAALAGLGAGLSASLALRDSIGWRPLKTFARCALAGAIVGVGLYYLTPLNLADPVRNAVTVLIAYPAAIVVYLALLGVTRELDGEDVALVRSAMARDS